ncbi:hypothetical protein C9926_00710 [Sulfurovum lithotrophicum]|nr:hypothetical protein C9926_00710 [Sulfurovum lithotrophicum]
MSSIFLLNGFPWNLNFFCYFFLFCAATKEKRVTKKEKNASDIDVSCLYIAYSFTYSFAFY